MAKKTNMAILIEYCVARSITQRSNDHDDVNSAVAAYIGDDEKRDMDFGVFCVEHPLFLIEVPKQREVRGTLRNRSNDNLTPAETAVPPAQVRPSSPTLGQRHEAGRTAHRRAPRADPG
jgi:hypothetical protein